MIIRFYNSFELINFKKKEYFLQIINNSFIYLNISDNFLEISWLINLINEKIKNNKKYQNIFEKIQNKIKKENNNNNNNNNNSNNSSINHQVSSDCSSSSPSLENSNNSNNSSNNIRIQFKLYYKIKELYQLQFQKQRKKYKRKELLIIDDIYENVLNLIHNVIFVNENIILEVLNEKYFLPNNSIFILDDIRKGLQSLVKIKKGRKRYKTIVIDPPWNNKSVRRGNFYQTSFSNEELIKLGQYLEDLYHSDGCVVAIWVTNNSNVINFVLNELLKEWNLEYIDIWWWIKLGITNIDEEQFYQPICSVNSKHRKPYERVIIAYRNSNRINKTYNTQSERNHVRERSVHVCCCSIVCNCKINENNEIDNINDDTNTTTTNNNDNELSQKDCICKCTCSIFSSESLETLELLESSTSLQESQESQELQESKKRKFEELERSDCDETSPFNQPIIYPELSTEIIFSFPIRHSWKPPLQDLLKQTWTKLQNIKHSNLMNDELQINISENSENDESDENRIDIPISHTNLELFARELREGCTSIGNEVLFHQTMEYCQDDNTIIDGFLKLTEIHN